MKIPSFAAASVLLTFSATIAQEVIGDKHQTTKGELVIQPILHGTIAMAWSGNVIYVDPYGGAEAFAGTPDPDLVFITDIHGDHLNAMTLAEINLNKATLVVPQAVYDKLDEDLKAKAKVIANGEQQEFIGVGVEAVPMYNLPESSESRHTKGRGNGYVLTMGSKRVYISGDTEDIPEMRALKNIDIAFVCMNLPYTMDVEQASDAVLEFKPKVIYPFHYRGGGGKFSDVEKFKELVNNGNNAIDVRLRTWYPQ